MTTDTFIKDALKPTLQQYNGRHVLKFNAWQGQATKHGFTVFYITTRSNRPFNFAWPFVFDPTHRSLEPLVGLLEMYLGEATRGFNAYWESKLWC